MRYVTVLSSRSEGKAVDVGRVGHGWEEERCGMLGRRRGGKVGGRGGAGVGWWPMDKGEEDKKKRMEWPMEG